MFANSDELLKYIKNEAVEMVDVRFCDLPGVMQHFTVPVSSFDQSVFDDGLNFDGSSIRGFQAIHESDMSLFPDPTTAYLDPFRSAKTLVVNFFIHDPITGEAYSRDPRNIARKAQAYLSSTGIGDTAYFAPEAEFYVFDDVRFETKAETGFYSIDSVAGAWNTGREEERGNLGYKVKYKGGYFPVAPTDHFGELRDEIVIEMEKSGLLVERAHHEVGTAGQAEINWRFDELLPSADNVMKFKYLVKNVAWRNNKTATFMPKPIFGDNGSGMHCHQSIWNDGEPLFFDETGYAGLSDVARYYIGGLLKHAPSLLAASRLRSAWSTASATAPPACGSRSPARTRRPSGSSSAALTRRPTPTSRSPRCCSPVSTASRTRSSRPHPSTRTSTSFRRTRWPRSTRSRPRSTRCSTTWRPTTTS
jgi:glutamine synthetase